MKCVVLFALMAASAAAQSVPLDLDIGGRVAAVRNGVLPAYVYQWPGVYFEARFAGPSVDVKVDDGENNLYLYVDGLHKLTLTRPGRTTVSLKDLGPGPHVVRLEKVSETQSTTAKFEGFFVPSPQDALPPPRYQRRVEFVGDSFTVGYGNQSRGQTCTVDDVRDTTDTAMSFATVTAKRFDAAYRINAFSGRGIVRNYNGMAPGDSLPVLYNYTLFDKSVSAQDDGWVPDAIVIGLGTNDFSTPLNPGERWASREDLRVDFVNSYAAFVTSLHARWPAAPIVLMASTGYDNEIAESVRLTAVRLHEEGLDVDVIAFSGLDYQACHGHPSLKDEEVLSQLLYERLVHFSKFKLEQ